MDAVRALQGLRGHVIRALIPAFALAIVAGGTAGAVTIVSLAGTEVTVVEDTVGDDPIADASVASDDANDDDVTAEDATVPTPSSSDEDPDDAVIDESAEETAPVVLTFEEAVAKHGRSDYSAILTRRFPGAQWSLNGSRYSGLTWLDGSPKPTQAELDALWPSVAEELAAERAAQEAAEAAAAAAREAELEARRNDPDVQALLDSFDPRIIWGPNPDYAHILSRRFPGAQWSLSGNDPTSGLVWHEDGPKPTKAQLDAMWAEVAREMALEMDPKELARWAGTGDEVYVDGVLRPKGWVGGADDPQPDPPAITRSNCSIMPFLPNDGGGKTIDVWKDPTGAKNFDMVIGISYSELMFRIAEAHGFWGDQYCGVGFSVISSRTFSWHSSQVDESIIVSILTSLGALPANSPAAAPEPDPEPSPEPDPDPVEESAPEATEDDDTTEPAGDGTGDATDDGDTSTDPDADPDPDPADEDTGAEPTDDEDDDGAED